MSHFNHAFSRVWVGTKDTQVASGTQSGVDNGFLTSAGVSTINFNNTAAPYKLGKGTFGFVDSTYTSVNTASLSTIGCCPLVLVGASLKANDKQGPTHGGYTETNKSKLINPKYVSKFYRVNPCVPQQSVVHVGTTNFTGTGQVLTITAAGTGSGYTNGTYTNVPVTGGTGQGMTVNFTVVGGQVQAGVTVNAPGLNYTSGDTVTIPGGSTLVNITINTVNEDPSQCGYTFFCGETYYLRVDIKGSPALRFAHHNLYRTFQADGGCCPTSGVPTEVDSTLIMIQWANAIVNDPYMSQFVSPVVFDQYGQPWYAPGTTGGVQTWNNYVSAGYVAGTTAGIRLLGAFVETKFGNCTFQVTDHWEKEPIKILASLVDYTGDPCTFEGICVVTECEGVQGNGFGEQAVRDVLLSEEYRQNFFHSDLRIREITQGDQMLDSLDRNALYYRYYIQHSVPRFNNPSSTFDTDQYLLEIITDAPSSSFEAFMATWLDGCGNGCASMEVFGCNACDIIPVGV